MWFQLEVTRGVSWESGDCPYLFVLFALSQDDLRRTYQLVIQKLSLDIVIEDAHF